MDHFRVSNYFYCYSSFKRCKSDRRTRWTGYREFGNHRCHIRHSRLSIRTYRLCLLFEHHVYSGNRRVSGFRQCVHRSDDRIPMVQRISCPSFHGRYGKPHFRRYHSSIRNYYTQRTINTHSLRDISCRRIIGNDSGRLFPVYKTEIRRRETHIQDDPVTPSFPETGKCRNHSVDTKTFSSGSGIKNRCPVLDHWHYTCGHYHRNFKNAIKHILK